MPPKQSSGTHTPKPWIFKGGVVVGSDGRGLGSSSGRAKGEVDANIFLACAAPELLEAAKDALEWMDPDNETEGLTEDEFHSDQWNACIRIRAAINKAEGRK